MVKKIINSGFVTHVFVTAVLMFCLNGQHAVARSEADLMEQTIADIGDLRAKMSEKMAEASQIHLKLHEWAEELKAEIREEEKQNHVKNYRQASGLPRVHFNLKLLQMIQAYMQELEGRIRYYQAGNQRLEFLLIQAQDDLKVIKTLRNLDVQKLLIQTNEALAIYQPAIQGHMIDMADVTLPPVEVVWRETVRGD